MIKENQKLFNAINVISDALLSVVAVVASFVIVFYLLAFERNFLLIDYIKLSCIFIPVQLVTYSCMGLYESYRTATFGKELAKLVSAFFIDGLLIIAMLYIVKLFDFSRWALAIFLVLDLVFVAVKRVVMRYILRGLRRKGHNQKHVLLIGGGAAALNYLETIRAEKQLGINCVGYLADRDSLDAKWLGGFDDIIKLLDGNCYDDVVCALDMNEMRYMQSVVEACEITGTRVSVIPAMYKYMSPTSVIDMVGGIPVMNIRRIPLDNMGNAFLKRAMDIIVSLIMLILFSPVMLVCAIVIKATMGGKVIFRQQRVGYNKKIFTMYKFKSMTDSSTSDTAWSTDSDPRKTKFGAVIRKLSIDEIPQLVNVLKGDMSLVGPRPEIPFYVDAFKNEVPMYMIKHQVKPGITGLAQVNGYRGDTSIKRRIELDVQYIENWNIFLDISILFKTVFRVVNKEKLRCSELREGTQHQ
ncbi:MAG: undecaprenyl-phosphate glucose phosphotransferase [Ruminococcaceae bacterium]|nr:undecaprenyl-phosphate glucose phosphotransferase [Oscillospiraceae bacterium]